MNMFRHKLTFWDQLFQIRQRLLRPCTAFWGMHSGRSSSTAPAKTWLSRYWLRMIYCNWMDDKWSVMGDGLQPQDTVYIWSYQHFSLDFTWIMPCGWKFVKSAMMDGEATNIWAANLQTLASDCLCFQRLLTFHESHDTSPSSFLSFTHSESPPKHLRSFHGSRRDKPHQSSNALSTFEFFHPSPKSEKLDSIFERSESLVFLQVRSLWWTSPSLSEWTLPQQPPQFSRSSWDYMTMLMLMPKYNRT